MKENMEDLRGQIAEKNQILESLSPENPKNRDKIYWLKRELDRLLYRYFKSLKCENANALYC